MLKEKSEPSLIGIDSVFGPMNANLAGRGRSARGARCGCARTA